MWPGKEQGAALVVALLLLLVVTLIGIASMTNSSLELRMAGNTQLIYDSFQSAEAGVSAVMSHPENFAFTGTTASKGNSELLKDGVSATVGVTRYFPTVAMGCPPKENGSSATLFNCEFFQVDSQYQANNTPAHLYQGVTREVVANQ